MPKDTTNFFNTSENDRIPTIQDINKKSEENKSKSKKIDEKIIMEMKLSEIYKKSDYNNMLNHSFRYREDIQRRYILKKEYKFYNYCIISVCLSFILGLLIGVFLMGSTQTHVNPNLGLKRIFKLNNTKDIYSRSLNSLKHVTDKTEELDEKKEVRDIKKDGKYYSVSFTGDDHKYNKDVYPKGLTDDMKDILKDNKIIHHRHIIGNIVNKTTYAPNDRTILYDNIYWGPQIEGSMPQGYGENTADVWERYVNQSEVVKIEPGCGRMQNRLVTFRDGIQACVRYRQNTDQIQGEIFSFYVARLLNLTNLAPSVIKVVDLKDKLWNSVAADISAVQWNSNRAVVLTQYIPSLESATIPEIFKPANRHLNKLDVLQMTLKENDTAEAKATLINKLKVKNHKIQKKNYNEKFDHIDMDLNKKTIDLFVELAQWSDLIIFDYLTANLDRIVNNLFNYQWNINIMDGPAHNLARKMDSGLLMFLDNESGLLHGYRLLKKYNVYHSLMLDNLCVYRRNTVDALRKLYNSQSIGVLLSDMFHSKNNAVIRDILPPLPAKNAKILHERIGKVLSQVDKCAQTYAL